MERPTQLPARQTPAGPAAEPAAQTLSVPAHTSRQATAAEPGDVVDAINNSPRMQAQRMQMARIAYSPRMVAQLAQIGDSFGLQALPAQAAKGTVASHGPAANHTPIQRQPARVAGPNRTGLPDNLKSGIEALSGISMDPVKVHYNSDKPAQLGAYAYAQGTDIHVAPGEEQHLPHEAWHVVQQSQGRVRPTLQMKDGVAVNDEAALEHEADVMGSKALLSPAAPIENSAADDALQRRAVQAEDAPASLMAAAPVDVVQRDDVVEGQTDSGDLVDGVAEATEMFGALSLSDDDDEGESVLPSGLGFGSQTGFGQQSAFGQPSGFGTPSPFGSQTDFGQQSPFGQPSGFGTPSPFGSQTGFGQPSTFGQPSGFGTPSPFGSQTGFGQQSVFGQPSALGTPSPFGSQTGFGQQSVFGQPSNPGTPAPFGSYFGPASGGHTFESFASMANSNPQGWPRQFRSNSKLPLQLAALPRSNVIQRVIGANKVQHYTSATGTNYTYKTTMGGYVNFDAPGPGFGPALAVHADVNIMDPIMPTKLNVPPAYRRTNPKQDPPLKNKRSMHFLAANWVRNGTISTASPAPNTWHHHKDKGRMQLLDAEVHGNINHNGGHSTWGKK